MNKITKNPSVQNVGMKIDCNPQVRLIEQNSDRANEPIMLGL